MRNQQGSEWDKLIAINKGKFFLNAEFWPITNKNFWSSKNPLKHQYKAELPSIVHEKCFSTLLIIDYYEKRGTALLVKQSTKDCPMWIQSHLVFIPRMGRLQTNFSDRLVSNLKVALPLWKLISKTEVAWHDYRYQNGETSFLICNSYPSVTSTLIDRWPKEILGPSCSK